MKKHEFTILSFFAVGILFGVNNNQVEASQIYTDSIVISTIDRGPLTGPDGENLYPGGGGPTFNPNILVVEDSFIDWSSSFFTPQWIPWANPPIMTNGNLTLPLDSAISGEPVLLSRNSTYIITLGDFQGTVAFNVIDQVNGMPLFPERFISGQGTSVAFYYRHSNAFDWNRNSIITLLGITDASMSSFKIEKLP